MKKIGILTYHYVDNYGAVLQAWALREILNRMPDIQAEIINYVPRGYVIYPYDSSEYGFQGMRKKRNKYEDFLMSKCGINTRMIQKVTGEGFDFCCVGSDQVWNLSFRENCDREYLFPNLMTEVKCFSYAASIGSEIGADEADAFRESLKRFSVVSVREGISQRRLNEIGINNIEVSVDPTLLLGKEDYEELISEPEKPVEDFVFFFSYPIGEEVRRYTPFVNMLARKYGLKVKHSCVNIPDNLIASNEGTMIYEGIGEFLWYMKHAKIIVTTSYHGAIFGSIYNHPTYIICRETGKQRFMQLSEILGIKRFVDSKWILQEWEEESFICSNDCLSKWKEKSMNYLRKALYD